MGSTVSMTDQQCQLAVPKHAEPSSLESFKTDFEEKTYERHTAEADETIWKRKVPTPRYVLAVPIIVVDQSGGYWQNASRRDI